MLVKDGSRERLLQLQVHHIRNFGAVCEDRSLDSHSFLDPLEKNEVTAGVAFFKML